MAWYLAHNPDVVASGADPVIHYLQLGAAEGRNPSRDFNTVEYLELHPQAAMGINPLLDAITPRPAADTG